jgi:hypothetical protein
MKTNRWNCTRRSDRAGEAGQTTVFFVLVLGLFLLGALSLAFDLSNMWFHRQAAQTAADAACAAGAMDLLVDAEGGATGHQGFTAGTAYDCTTTSTDSVCQYAAKNGYNSNNTAPGNLVSVSFPAGVIGVNTPPASIAPTPFIRVDIVDNVQTFFLGLLSGGTSATVRAFSTCGVELAQSPIPLVVLDPRFSDSKTFNVQGSPVVSIYGGPQQSIQVNSPNVQAANLGGSACIDLSQGGGDPGTGSDLGTYGGLFANQVSTSSCTPAASGSGFNPGTTGHWLAPNPPLKDPFEQVQAPAQPSYTPANPYISNVTPGTTDSDGNVCPTGNIDHCEVYRPGNYPSGITVKGPGGPNIVLSLFEPGIYYITGGITVQSNSCIRPGTAPGDGSGGTMFYFADTNSINVGSDSGNKCYNEAKGVANVPAFNTSSGTGSLLYGAKCTNASSLPKNMPGTLTGTVLLGPCQKPDPSVPTGTLLCDPNCSLNFGDPQGTSDPLGEQRGFLFFQNRGQNAGTAPKWNGGGQFLLAGTMYFHQCVTTGTDTGTSCSNANAFNDVFNLQGNSSSNTYILGQIIVDQLSLGGNTGLVMDLNSNQAYNILKASIFQ